MSYLFGTQARVYGIGGNIKLHDTTNTNWASLSGNKVCVITGYTFTPARAGEVQAFDQTGRLAAEAFAYATFEVALTFEFGSTSLSGTSEAKGIIMPNLMAKITLENMDNADLNGAYNFIAGSVTGTNQGWKVGNMTLRRISAAANTNTTSAIAFSAVS